MSEIPKFVQSRLSRPVPGSHPDADMLTAFVERALPDAERTKVLEHLARCADCRDVVALAQPEITGPTQAVLVPSKGNLLRWPVMRWAAVAACLVIGAAISLQVLTPKLAHDDSLEKRAEAPVAAKVADEPAVARDQVKSEMVSNGRASVSREQADLSPARGDLDTRMLAQKAAPMKESKIAGLDRKSQFGGYSQQRVPTPAAPGDNLSAKVELPDRERADYDKNYGFQGYSNAMTPRAGAPTNGAAANQVVAVPSVPAPSQGAVVVGGRLAEAEVDTRSHELAKARAEAPAKKTDAVTTKQEGTSDVAAGLKDERQKAAADTGVVTELPVQGRSVAPVIPAAPPAPAPGHVSETVEVTAAPPEPAPASTSESVQVTAANPAAQTETAPASALQTTAMMRALAILPRWRLSKDHQLERASGSEAKWQQTSLDGQPELHALFFSGPNVWVGGKGGILFHSADAGEHWQRVAASHDGIVLTDDIVAIDFKDFQRGQFKTDKKKVWITADGGQTWAPK